VLPIRLPLPKGARIIWLLSGDRVQDFGQVIPLRKAQPLYYTDLPPDFTGFRWGSFQFAPADEFDHPKARSHLAQKQE